MEKRTLNRHQKKFFSNLRRHPDGLPPALWPRGVAMKRWLTQDAFCRRLQDELAMSRTVRGVIAERVAAEAARKLLAATTSGDTAEMERMLRLMKNARSRERRPAVILRPY